jgi:excinuclease UvrABC helicase subunit UvrB
VAGPQDPSRRRTRRLPQAPDTGRQHHLGAAPAAMPVLGDGAPSSPTRTAAVQLAARTQHELAQLLDTIGAEMARAAGELDFETAAARRDEAELVRAELARRA